MKRKLTITVDEQLIPRAKAAARRRGLSLSALIERALEDQAGQRADSFSSRWRGKFVAAGKADERYKALARKYL